MVERLRVMCEADIAQVWAIELQLTPSPWNKQQFIQSIFGGDECHVLDRDGIILGYSILNIVLDEASLLNIAVAPEYQRQGLGKVLLTEVLVTAQNYGCRQCFLEVRASNHVAIALYKQFNFQQVGLRRGYYPAIEGREDAIMMMKKV